MIRIFCQGRRQTCVNAVDRRSNPYRLFDGKSIDAEGGRSALRDQEPVDRLKKRILPGARLMTHRGLLRKIPRFDCLNPQEFDQLSSLLDRSGFESFFVQNPKILEYVARVLAQRLARVSRGQLPPRRSLVISVTGKAGVRGKSLTASVLAGLNPSLQTHGFYRKRSQGCRKSVTEYQGCNCRETLRRISAMTQTA